MKITVNKDITCAVQDILIAILLIACIAFAYGNSNIMKENEEIKARYDIVQEEKTELLKKIKEVEEQDSITNNFETRGGSNEKSR